MAIEEQVLQFVVQVTDKAASSTMAGLKKGFDLLANGFKSLTNFGKMLAGGLGMLGGAFKGLTQVIGKALLTPVGLLITAITALVAFVTKAVAAWSKFHASMMEFRKQTGMTTQGIYEFSAATLDASRKYGVEMQKVGDIARLLTTGTTRAKKGVVDLAGSMAQFAMATGTSTETAAEMADTLANGLKMSDLEVKRFSYGLLMMAQKGGPPVDMMAKYTANMRKSFMALGDEIPKNVIPNITAYAAELIKSGASQQDAEEITRQMLDVNTQLGKQFQSQGYNLDRFKKSMFNATDAQMKNTSSLQFAAQTWSVGADQLRVLHRSTQMSGEYMKAMGKAGEASATEINNAFRKTQTPADKWKAMWNEHSAAIGRVADAVSEFATWALDNLLISWEAATKWLGKALWDTWEVVVKVFTTIKEWLGAFWNGVIKEAWNWGTGLVNSILEGLKSAWVGVTEWFSGALDTIKGLWPFSPAKHGPLVNIDQAGRGFVNEIKSGMVEAEPDLQRAVANMGGRAKAGYESGRTQPTNITAPPGATAVGPPIPISEVGTVGAGADNATIMMAAKMIVMALQEQTSLMEKPTPVGGSPAGGGGGGRKSGSGFGLEGMPLAR